MIRVAFFDTKPYDREAFEAARGPAMAIHYFEGRLKPDTVSVAAGFDAVCSFVNDNLNREVIDALCAMNVRLIALRSAGFNHVDVRAAQGRIPIVRVPGYSPNAVAEHAMALLLCLNRKLFRSYIRTRDHNFSLNGLTGFDLNGRVAGVIGTGRIGQAFIRIARGFGMRVLAHDPRPIGGLDVEYADVETVLRESDVVSLHCPLTDSTRHLINEKSLALMKKDAILINTSRGALVDSRALLDALREGRLGGAALDVYEEETDLFFEDRSEDVLPDETLSLLLTLPSVLITAHQAFLTEEALCGIARTTVRNIDRFFREGAVENEVTVHI